MAETSLVRLSWWEELQQFRLMIRNYVDAARALQKKGDAVFVRLPMPIIAFFRPAQIDHILRTNLQNYPKSDDYKVLHSLLGEGIFVAEGETWQRQRKLLSPEFRASVIPHYLPMIVSDVEALFSERWEQSVGKEPRDIADDMMFFTLRVVGDSIFASDFRQHAEAIGHALETCLDQATFRMMVGQLLPEWFPTPGNLAARKAEQNLDSIVNQLIQKDTSEGMLARLKGSMSPQQLLYEVKSMILAGHETTSLALSWCFYLLSLHPEWREKLEKEVEEVLGDRPIEAADIQKLSLVKMVFLETMRLYPPVPVSTRVALQDDVIEGVPVKAGQKVAVHIAVVHRHPEFWKEPERFDPTRFASAKEFLPGSYVPFVSGKRVCLGEHFAMLEGIVALAMIVRRYRLHRSENTPILTRPISTLRLSGPLMMRIERR